MVVEGAVGGGEEKVGGGAVVDGEPDKIIEDSVGVEEEGEAERFFPEPIVEPQF